MLLDTVKDSSNKEKEYRLTLPKDVYDFLLEEATKKGLSFEEFFISTVLDYAESIAEDISKKREQLNNHIP